MLPSASRVREKVLTTPYYADGELIPGTVYRVQRRLGAAGFGAVYQVEDTKVGGRYCLKTLQPFTEDLEQFRERLALEARALSRLAHPNVVQVLTAGVTGDARRLPFFVMELLEGRTLRETLEHKGKLDAWFALTIATQVLDALEHAHGRGIVHRDVKPENIFIHRATGTTQVQAKLLDFGVMAFVMDSSSVGADAGITPRYAAPELLEGGAATPASDLYSMGLVLYEMLCGHGPFDGGDLSDVARARLERDPAPLDVEAPIVLEDLILSALERNPLLRPADAFSFGETLRLLANRISRLPQTSLLSTEPPPSNLPAVSDIPDGLVEADWRPPATPRAAEVEEILGGRRKRQSPEDRDSLDPLDSLDSLDSRGGSDSDIAAGSEAPKRSIRPSTFDRASGRETLVGVALGLALILATLVVVMLK